MDRWTDGLRDRLPGRETDLVLVVLLLVSI